jgi:hypothetical protein
LRRYVCETVKIFWRSPMIKVLKLSSVVLLISLIAACQPILVTTPNEANALQTNATTLTVNEAYPIKGSEKVTVHAYSYLRVSQYCSRTVAIQFRSLLAYPQTLIALRNRAMITGANALAITDWNEQSGYTTLSAHFFDCHSKRGL